MNKQRRKALGAIQDRLIALKLDDVFAELESIEAELRDIRDDEEDAVDRMIDGPRKDDAQAGIDNLEAALSYISGLRDAMEDENPVSLIDEARGCES